MPTVDLFDARTHLSQLVERAAAGERDRHRHERYTARTARRGDRTDGPEPSGENEARQERC
jgi:hypothetical protein